jgi:uncharacterized cupredoxin-like copper-binding protein
MTLLAVSTLFVVLTISSSRAESNTVRIRIGDLYFKPETIKLKAGQEVNIELVNEGKIEHEFMVGREVKMEEGKDETPTGMHEENGEKQEISDEGHEHHAGTHGVHTGMNRSFKKDFFEGIEIAAGTEKGESS